jgi:hypothetical protein
MTTIQKARENLEKSSCEGFNYWQAYLQGALEQSAEDAETISKLIEMLDKAHEQVEDYRRNRWSDLLNKQITPEDF